MSSPETFTVSASRVVKDGEPVFPKEAAPTALTSCRICMFTSPLEFTWGRMVRIFPVSRYCTVLTVEMLVVTACAVDVRIGTD